MSDLDTIRDGWNAAALDDPMFNIITDGRYAGNGWPPDEFFAHGQREVDEMIAHLDALDLRGPERRRALDFGCGVGRLTQALSGEYTRAVGADVSEEMIRLAREHNRHGRRCIYKVTGKRLRETFMKASFDLIYTCITLQHMPPDLQRGYVSEFVEMLRPGGVAVFRIPDGPEYAHPSAWLSMYGVPRATVEEWIADAGGTLLSVDQVGEAAPPWTELRYTCGPTRTRSTPQRSP